MSHVPGYINVNRIHPVLKKLREFFYQNDFKESFVQSRRQVLSACEDPSTISTYVIGGVKFPQQQTNQLGLEHDVLNDNNLKKLFCLSTSYRNEPNPKPRHDLTFPLFEYEQLGNYDTLLQTNRDLIRFMGYKGSIVEIDYDDACKRYGVNDLEHEHEEAMEKDLGPVVFLKNFPVRTHPFFNMKLHASGTHAYKLDVILGGVETIGSAERECDPDIMRKRFYEVSDGEYSKKLFNEFGQDRVEEELNEMLSYKFMPRVGAGIGVTRLLNFLEKYNLN